MAFPYPLRDPTPINSPDPRKARIPPGMCPVPKDLTKVDDQGLLNLHRGFHLFCQQRKVQAGHERVAHMSRSWDSIPVDQVATRREIIRAGETITLKYLTQLDHFEARFLDAFGATSDEKASTPWHVRKKPDAMSREITRGCSKDVIVRWLHMTVGEVEDLDLVRIPVTGPNPMKDELQKRGLLKRGRLAD